MYEYETRRPICREKPETRRSICREKQEQNLVMNSDDMFMRNS